MKVKAESDIIISTMSAVQRSEFSLALNQVAAERGVDASVVLETVKMLFLQLIEKIIRD